MATLDWWLKLWPLVGAIPGFIAFAWALQDRAERRKAERPFAQMRMLAEPDIDGWHPADIRVRNRWDEPASITAVIAPKGVVFAIAQRSPGFGPDLERSGRRIDVEFPIGAASQSGAWSAGFALFVRAAKPSTDLAKLMSRRSSRIAMISYARRFSVVPIKYISVSRQANAAREIMAVRRMRSKA